MHYAVPGAGGTLVALDTRLSVLNTNAPVVIRMLSAAGRASGVHSHHAVRIASGGAPLSHGLETMTAMGVDIMHQYGLTESVLRTVASLRTSVALGRSTAARLGSAPSAPRDENHQRRDRKCSQ